MRDPLDTHAIEAEQADAERKAEQRAKQEVEDLKWLLAHAQGRRFMWRLLSMSGVFRTSMTGNSMTFFREGERNVGLQFFAQVSEHCPDAYAKMLKESKE